MKKYIFHVSGTHCASCKTLIEHALNKLPDIQNVHVNLKTEQVMLETVGTDEMSLAAALSEKMKTHGYVFSTEKIEVKKGDDAIIWQAVPIGL